MSTTTISAPDIAGSLRTAELEQELGAARDQIVTLANRVRDLEQTNITPREAARLRHRVEDLNRRNNAAYGMSRQVDVHDPGRVAVFLVDLRYVLGSSRDQQQEQS